MKDQRSADETSTTEEIMAAGAERHDLSSAPLGELLSYGLTCNDQDPILGVFEGVRDDLALLATLGVEVETDATVELAELGPVIEMSVRRLAVGIELLRRQRPRTRTSSLPPEPAP